MTTSLILIDIQNDYFTGGKMGLIGINEASANAAALLDVFREKGWPTFHIQHIFENDDAPFFVAESDGININDSVKPLAGETIVVKHHPNSFLKTTLLEEIQQAGVEDVVICGAMSHMCVDATTRAAADLGLNCTLIHDACATRNLEFEGREIEAAQVHGAFMSALGWGYAQLQNADEWLKQNK